MALELKISQKMTQSLVMTPQLQQAIKLLQLGRQEYLEVIENELLENPILEDVREDTQAEGSKEILSELESFVGEDSEGAASAVDEAQKIEQGIFNVEADKPYEEAGDNFQTNSEEIWQQGRGNDIDEQVQWAPVGRRVSGDDEMPSLESTLSKPEGLESHLFNQLRVTDMASDDAAIATQIIGNLDKDGYLSASTEEIAELCHRDVNDVEQVLKIIQDLDPPGVGARDLRECLLIQLDQKGLCDQLVWRVVDKHLSKIEIRRYDLIAKEEGIAVESVYEAVKIIQTLEPRPGRPFIVDTPVYITPDVYVRKVGEDYVISLNDADLPRLKLSAQYKEMLEQTKKSPTTEDRDYLQDKARSALWLIKSIHQRQQTIYRVTESIMKFQREFLENGVKALRPLVLRDVAEDLSMHESTVSRVTTNKYVHTPQGVYELKYFFSSGLRSEVGDVSSESVKDRIKTLIDEENPKSPLSDQELVNMLRAEGIDIARRTVAKYREMLNILSSSRRKKVF